MMTSVHSTSDELPEQGRVLSFGPARRPSIGIVGYGAFGRLMAFHLAAWFEVFVYDQKALDGVKPENATPSDLVRVAGCEIVILATPVASMASVIASILPHLKPGSLVMDVGSVKVIPAQIMLDMLPESVDIIATHPLFGPESAKDGFAGLKIAICPLRSANSTLVRRFLRTTLKLDVILTTPDLHDREVATSQALVHLIAKVLVQMEPLPETMTTVSFDLLMRSIDMVRNDAPNVFSAIEHANPYAPAVRQRFFALAAQVSTGLSEESVVCVDEVDEIEALIAMT